MQYEIIAGGAGARATKDGASGITVNQSNAMIAPVEIIESEFPTRILRFELIENSGGAGRFRGGLGIRREYLNLEDARFSIRSMKHVIPPNGCAGGSTGRPGDIWINPDSKDAKRLPTRYADYPLKEGDIFRLDTPGGGGHGDPLAREPERVLADVREGFVIAGGGRARLRRGGEARRRDVRARPGCDAGAARQGDDVAMLGERKMFEEA